MGGLDMDKTTEKEKPVWADFNPFIKPYLVISSTLFMCITVVLIPFAIVWFLGLGWWWANRYFEKLECVLDSRTLHFRKGVLFQIQKTIPLENIQDVTFLEGPFLRAFNLTILRLETAGQGQNQGNDMQLVGIINADNFRRRILENRERLRHHIPPHNRSAGASTDDEQVVLLKEIRDRLNHILILLQEQIK